MQVCNVATYCFESSTPQQDIYKSELSDINEDLDTSYASLKKVESVLYVLAIGM